jgi:hypothetical protein
MQHGSSGNSWGVPASPPTTTTTTSSSSGMPACSLRHGPIHRQHLPSAGRPGTLPELQVQQQREQVATCLAVPG